MSITTTGFNTGQLQHMQILTKKSTFGEKSVFIFNFIHQT